MVMEFEDLQEGSTYTIPGNGWYGGASSWEGNSSDGGHRQDGNGDDAAAALQQQLLQEGVRMTDIELRSDLRQLRDASGRCVQVSNAHPSVSTHVC
jgi:hypothetical protein